MLMDIAEGGGDSKGPEGEKALRPKCKGNRRCLVGGITYQRLVTGEHQQSGSRKKNA